MRSAEQTLVTLSEAAVRLGITKAQATALCIREGIKISNGRIRMADLERATADAILSE